MTEEEKELFTAWGNAPDLPLTDQIQTLVLEGFLSKAHASADDVRAYITARVAGYAESSYELSQRIHKVLGAAFQPLWFPEALMAWPGQISPPSWALLDRRTARRRYTRCPESFKPSLTGRLYASRH